MLSPTNPTTLLTLLLTLTTNLATAKNYHPGLQLIGFPTSNCTSDSPRYWNWPLDGDGTCTEFRPERNSVAEVKSLSWLFPPSPLNPADWKGKPR